MEQGAGAGKDPNPKFEFCEIEMYNGGMKEKNSMKNRLGLIRAKAWAFL